MDWTDIEARLQERAEEVCRHLLPEGKRMGAEYQCGDLSGKAGDSLRVNLAGKVGMWSDFADSGKRGGKTLISLWCSVRGRPFKECIVEAKKFLGISDDFRKRVEAYGGGQKAEPEESTWKAVQEIWARCQPLTEEGPVWNYLVQQRKLEPAVLEWFGVRELPSRGHWVMVFPYSAAPGEPRTAIRFPDEAPSGAATTPAWMKFERLDRPEGKKQEWTSKGPEKVLWGLQLDQHPMFKGCRDVLICEGEKDALSWASYGCGKWGILPLSVPFGAKWKGQEKGRPSPNREWLDRCWEWLQGYETVYVAMDSDEAGRRAAADIVEEIGPRRCRLVVLPRKAARRDGAALPERYKDVNECLQAGLPWEEMKACLDEAMDFAPEKVVPAEAYRQRFMEEWFERPADPGLELPWNFPFKIRPSELTVWTGIEKSGKSTLLGFVLVGLMAQGERALVASMEVKSVKSLKKWSRQVYGGLLYDKRMVDKCQNPEELETYRATMRGEAEAAFTWLAKHLWLYDHVGIVPWRTLMDDLRWARRRFGITQFVIDNFMRLGIAKDDYTQQADCITALAAMAMELDVHLHVVVHQNKSEGHKGRDGGKRTVSGAYEIIANAHNIVEVQRDDVKGQKVSELFEKYKIDAIGETQFREEKAALDLVPDGKFILRAQRDGDVQDGSKLLWFLWESQQYADKPPGHRDHAPIRFMRAPQPQAMELPTTEELDLRDGAENQNQQNQNE